MIGEVIGKALVVVKGDTSHARAEIAKLSAEEQKAAKARIKAQDDSNAALERGQQRLALFSAAAVAGWTVVSSSIEKYKKHLEELGGGRDLDTIRKTTEQLTEAQNSLQYSIAKVALVAAPAAVELAKMAESIAAIVGGIGGLLERAKNLPGAGFVAKGASYAWKYNPLTASTRLAGDAYGAIYGPDQYMANTVQSQVGRESGSAQYGDGAQEQMSPEWYRAMGWQLQADGRWLPPEKKVKTRRGGGRRVDPYAGARRDFNAQIAATSGYARGGGAGIDYGADEVTFDRGAYNGPVDDDTLAKISAASKDLEKFMAELEAKQKGDEKSAMEKILGPIEEFDKYAIGFGLVRDAATSAYDAVVSGSMGATEAIRKSIGAGIHALGKDMLIRSLQEGAWAIADLAKGNFPGAALHGKAAAAFGAGAVAAGIAAHGLNSSGGGGGAGSANANAAAGLGGGGRSSGGDRGTTSLTVVMGDSFAGDSPRYVARKVRRNIDNARQYATYGQEGM